MIEERFNKRYKEGNTPWDIGKPDFNLLQTVATMDIKPCKALDIGCGTGHNSIWLCQNNFEVTGIDASEIAIQRAMEEAAKANVQCNFASMDFRTNQLKGASFGFAFDRGCFHALKSEEERKVFAENVAFHLEKEGLWLSIIGNADEKRDCPGPPQRTARDIVNAVEPYFEILSLVTGRFGSNRTNPPRAWICLMQKRSMT